MLLLFWRSSAATIAAEAATATSTAQTAQLRGGVTVAIPVATAVATAPAATLAIYGTLSAPVATADVAASTPAITAVRNAVLGAPSATVTAAAPDAAVTVDAVLTSASATVAAQAHTAALHTVVPVGPPTLVPPATATAGQFTATNAANLSVPLPPGWQPNDIHVMWMHRSDNTAATAISGWTQIAALSGNNTTAQRVEVWVRRAVAGDTDPVPVTFGTSTIVRGARIVGVRGVPTTGLVTDQIDAQARSSNATADLTIEFSAVTTTDVNRFLLLLAAFEDDPNAATTPTGFTAPAGNGAGSTLGNDMSLWYWHRDVTTAQTVTPAASTVSGGGVGVSPSVGISIAFKGLLEPAGSVVMAGALAATTTSAVAADLEAEAGAVDLLAQPAVATALAPVALYRTGGQVVALAATSTASTAVSGLLAGTSLPAPVAASSAQARTPVITTGARLSAPTAVTTTQAETAIVSVRAVIAAVTALAAVATLIAVFSGVASFFAGTATTAVSSYDAAMGAITVYPTETATATAGAESATLEIAGSIDAAPADVTASAPSGAFFFSIGMAAQTATITASARPIQFIVGGVSAIVMPAPIIDGTGDVPVAGTGDIVMPAPPIVGQAFFAHTLGSSDIVVPAPILDSAGAYSYIVFVDITIPPPIVEGAGATPITGYGNPTIDGPSLSGIGIGPFSGTGALIIAGPSVEGTGTLIWTATAAITVSKPALIGLAPIPPPGPPPPLPPSDVHIIEAFDVNGTLLGRVQPIMRAKFTMVENDTGDFEIELPWIYDDIINILQTRNRIEYSIKGTKVFGGFIMKRTFRQEGRYSIVTLSGPGYNGVLTGRVMIPPATQNDDVYVGLKADDLMKAIVRKHLGTGAAAARQIPGFVVASNLSQSATTANYNGRYETVLDSLKSIAAEATDTKFQVIRNSAGILEFRTYVPIIGVDHGLGQADTVLFDTAGGNVLNVEYTEDGMPVRNYIIGGGTGDGADRLIREGFNTESITDWGRIEEFLDTSAETSPELDLEILKRLEETSRGGPSLTFTIGHAGRFEYPVDFGFGDRVSAIWKEAGLTLTDVISGMTINLEESGSMQIEMSIGAPNLFRLSPGRALARYIKALRGEVSVMQRH